jgi:aminopeptidase
MTVAEYTAEIIKACHLDKADPIAVWSGMREQAEAVKSWLTGMEIDYIRIESDNIDLKVAIGESRRWLGFTGQNIPSFEIFTSPDWRGTEGIYFANEPSFRSGKYVKGVRLEFKAGRVIWAEAEQEEVFLRQMIAMDKGAGQLGEISFTDKRFSPIKKFMANTLYDENVGGEDGNCHVAIGFSFPDVFSGDKKQLTKKLKKQIGLNASALHWDLVNTERKRATAYLKGGGKVVIYEDGMFRN